MLGRSVEGLDVAAGADETITPRLLLFGMKDSFFFVTTTTRYEKQNDENAQMEVTIT